MRLLLDTHVFLWYITADPKLPDIFLAASQDPGNEVYLSVASVWEAVIKYHLGKFPLPRPGGGENPPPTRSGSVDEDLCPKLWVDDLADAQEIAIGVDDCELSKVPRLVFQGVHPWDTGMRQLARRAPPNGV